MEERVCLVTGATSGIGLVTARALAQQGATVVLVGRDQARTEATVASIRAATNSAKVDFLVADLSSQEQVRRLATAFQSRYPELHVLVNNAGAVFYRRQVTVDGLEMTFALNHLAPFLLTNLLLATLKASAPARVVTVASMAHGGASIPFDDLNQQRGRYSAFGVYGESKLANILFTYELARRLEGTAVTANALHPGFVGSNFGRAGLVTSVIFTLARPFAISTEEGAKTSIYLATSQDVEGVTGVYFARQKPIKSSRQSYDLQAQQRLWRVSEELTGLTARVG